jgi:hypothetical protein
MIVETIVIGKIVVGKIVTHPTVVAAHHSLVHTVAEWAGPVVPVAFMAGEEWLSKSRLDPKKKEALSNFLEGTQNVVSDWLQGHTPALDPGPASA